MRGGFGGPRNYDRVLSSNSTSASFPSRVPTETQPSGAGIIPVGPNTDMILLPFGRDGNNETLKVRVIGWRSTASDDDQSLDVLWVPRVIAELTCTLNSSLPGTAGAPVTASDYFADTITADYGLPIIEQDSGVLPASASVMVAGERFVEVVFDRNSSAAECNALYALQ